VHLIDALLSSYRELTNSGTPDPNHSSPYEFSIQYGKVRRQIFIRTFFPVPNARHALRHDDNDEINLCLIGVTETSYGNSIIFSFMRIDAN
jgi:hypothetical protein